MTKAQKPDALVISGDIYDKSAPSGAAVSLWDDFLTALSERQLHVLCISGNHDSPERVDFGSRIMKSRKIHIAGIFNGGIPCVTLPDPMGPVHFHLLPFLRPANVRAHYPEEAIASYADAMQVILAHHPLNRDERNILVAHQFVLPTHGDAERSESETEPVGGLNAIPSDVFDGYDYVALGHLHGPQNIDGIRIRYAGSPLKYSFSEHRQKKSITVVDMPEKGQCKVSAIPLAPVHDMRKISGPFEKLTSKTVLLEGNPEDYMHVTLTDEEEIIDAIGKLRRFYPNVMELAFDNSRTRAARQDMTAADIQLKSPLALFEEFYKAQNGVDMPESQKAIAHDCLKDIGGTL